MKGTRCLLLAFLILVLGCSGTPTAQRDVYGVEVQEFRPDLEEVLAGNNAILRLKAQNVGDYDATKVEAEIYKCGNLKVDGAKCPRRYSLDNLKGADISSNLPGKDTEKIFTLSTDSLKNMPNERVEQEIGLRLSYKYKSTATAEIPVLSNQRYKELEREGTLPKTKVDTALAPIQVGITAPEQAIGSAPISLDIELEKVIDGYVEGTGCGSGNDVGCIESVKIELSGKGLGKQDCSDKGGTQLWRTGKRTFSCTLKPDCTEGECYSVLKVTAAYTYVTETTTQITVKGVPGGVVPTGPSKEPEEEKSSYDVISLAPPKGYVSQDITVTGINFSKNDKNIHLYIEGDKYWIENGIRQNQPGFILAKLTPLPGEGTPNADGLGIDPKVTGDYGTFKATFKVPHAIAMSDSGATVGAFAVGQANENRSLTASEGHSNMVNLDVDPKTKITVSPSEARSGEGTTVELRGEKYPPNQPVSIYFLNPTCANYFGEPPITMSCAKQISPGYIPQVQTDPSGGFTASFELNEAFMYNGNTPQQGYKIPSGYYLVFATSPTAADANDFTFINGAGEFTILSGVADSDGDGIADTLDQCPNTPKGAMVCQIADAAIAGECFGRAGCEKMPVRYVEGSIVALKITSKETTGTYTIIYDDKKDYKFVVKKNGVEATLTKQPLTEIPRANDILFVFNVTNTGVFDVGPIDVNVRGITKDDLPTEPGHCMGIAVWAGKAENCALLKTDIRANNYVTQLKIVKGGDEFLMDGPKFTVN